MKILITGITGFIGQKLALELIKKNHEVLGLTRDVEKAKKQFETLPISFVKWSPEKEIVNSKVFSNVDVIVNLLGENISARRWSDSQKVKIKNSRVLGTKNLGMGLKASSHRLKKWIQTSAIGIYPNLHTTAIDEQCSFGNGFLATTCKEWENEAKTYRTETDKMHILRFGVVLGENGGALSKLLPLFKLGLGGPIGDGKQMMSWIHLNDLVAAIIFLIENDCNEEIFNLTAPNPVSNQEFTASLARSVHRFAFFKVPPIALKLAMGEMSSIILDSQKVTPNALLKMGFKFQYPTIAEALDEITGNIDFFDVKKKALSPKDQ